MVKSIFNISVDKDVAQSVEYNRNKENEIRKSKMKTPINKSEYLQSLIVIGLIIRTNKKDDIQKILDSYFQDESGDGK
jgi:hypothetical protein